jgi:hypothetical protein
MVALLIPPFLLLFSSKPFLFLIRWSKTFFDQVIFILEKVHIIWEPLLVPSTYKRSMCMVLESVFSRITKDILLLDDMAANETLQVVYQ